MPWIYPSYDQPLDALLPHDLQAHWTTLALCTGQGDPFCSAPAWNLAYYATFAHGNRVFVSKTGNSLILLCETVTNDGRIFLSPIDDGWFFGQPLLGSDAASHFAALLPGLIADCAPRVPHIFLSGILPKSFHAFSIYSLFSKNYHLFHFDSRTQASASLENGMDGWLSRRSANHRAKLRKSMRHAEKLGICFERHIPLPETLDSIYDRILAIEAKSWKGIGRCGMTESPSREFYRSLLHILARTKKALVIFATLANQDIGFIFGGICGSIYRGQQFSYIQEAAKLSIGSLLQFEKIRWLCELGVLRYDMGPISGERMQYKSHWTEEHVEVQTWVMRPAF